MVKICKLFERLTADGQTLLVVEFLIFCKTNEKILSRKQEKKAQEK